MGEVVHVGRGQLEAAQEEVVNQHRRYCDRDTYTGGDQGMADGPGYGFQAGRTGGADGLQRFHDPPHGAEQADKGRGAADTGEDRLAAFQGAAFLLDLLAQVALQAVGAVDGVGQLLGGARRVIDNHGFEAAVGDAGQGTGVLAGVFGGGQQVRGGPEGFAELRVLRFLAQVLR